MDEQNLNMKCPLSKISPQSGSYEIIGECWEKECGWWDYSSKKCAMIILANNIGTPSHITVRNK